MFPKSKSGNQRRENHFQIIEALTHKGVSAITLDLIYVSVFTMAVMFTALFIEYVSVTVHLPLVY